MKTNNPLGTLSLGVILFLLACPWNTLYAESILDRVMKVEDPELASCIRVAMQNYSPDATDAKLATIRAITEHYAQIKLLDTQIQQIQQRLNNLVDSHPLSHELILAEAELQSQQIQRLAQLRETMRVVPRYAFGQIRLGQLLDWVILDVLDEQTVLIFHKNKPFTSSSASYNYRFEATRPSTDALDYVTQLMSHPDQLPLRIDILHFPNVPAQAEAIHSRLTKTVKELALEMDIDLRLAPRKEVHSNRSTYTIANHFAVRPYILTTRNSQKIWGPRGIQTPDTIQNNILPALLGGPETLPLTWTLEYDPNSLNLAQDTAQRIEKTAADKGILGYVEVNLEPTSRQWLPPESWPVDQ